MDQGTVNLQNNIYLMSGLLLHFLAQQPIQITLIGWPTVHESSGSSAQNCNMQIVFYTQSYDFSAVSAHQHVLILHHVITCFTKLLNVKQHTDDISTSFENKSNVNINQAPKALFHHCLSQCHSGCERLEPCFQTFHTSRQQQRLAQLQGQRAFTPRRKQLHRVKLGVKSVDVQEDHNEKRELIKRLVSKESSSI